MAGFLDWMGNYIGPQNPQNYYLNQSSAQAQHGEYQFTTLNNIINNFMFMYVGEDKIISKINRTEVQFCGARAIQEFSYDIFRSVKSHEIEVPNTLKMPLPMDYVNYSKLTRVDSNGIERVLYPTGKTSNPFPIEQGSDGSYNFDTSTVVPTLEEQGADNTNIIITDDNTHEPFASNTLQNFTNQTVNDSHSDDTTDIEVDNYGRRYGLDPQHAQSNGTFFIDYRTGWIHFGSSLAGETIILKYISDGNGTEDEMIVHKFCEEAIYKWIVYCILSSKTNIPEYIVQRFKKEKFAEGRKAKIRLSNIKIEEFTQILKGLSKPIK